MPIYSTEIVWKTPIQERIYTRRCKLHRITSRTCTCSIQSTDISQLYHDFYPLIKQIITSFSIITQCQCRICDVSTCILTWLFSLLMRHMEHNWFLWYCEIPIGFCSSPFLDEVWIWECRKCWLLHDESISHCVSKNLEPNQWWTAIFIYSLKRWESRTFAKCSISVCLAPWLNKIPLYFKS